MKRKLISVLIAGLPALAMADSGADIKSLKALIQAQQQQLQAQQQALQALQKKVESFEQAQAKAPAAASDEGSAPAQLSNDDLAEIKQRVAANELKVNNIDKQMSEAPTGTVVPTPPLSGLSVTGYIDPAYIYNRNQGTGSFAFANHSNVYNYDNSTIGDVYLEIKKSFGTGPLAPFVDISIMPNKGNGITLLQNETGTNNNNNIINTANVTIPLSDTTQIVAGLIPSFGGYDVQQSNQMSTLTHNLLYDFSDPAAYLGAGFNWSHDVWAWKVFLGNEQARTRQGSTAYTTNPVTGQQVTQSNKVPTLTARLDYTYSSTVDLGASVNIGRQTLAQGTANTCTVGANNTVTCATAPTGVYGYNSTQQYGGYYFAETDLTYTGVDDVYNAEIDYGKQQHAAYNGGDAVWYGFSLQANHKFSTEKFGRMGITGRLDYLNNSKNGGGGGGIALGGAGTDFYNGFGISPYCFAASAVNGTDCKGSNHADLTFDFLWYATDQATLKFEYRHDWTNLPVFLKNDGSFSKHNDILGTQLVYSF